MKSDISNEDQELIHSLNNNSIENSCRGDHSNELNKQYQDQSNQNECIHGINSSIPYKRKHISSMTKAIIAKKILSKIET